MKDPIRNPPSDEGALNRAPGAFGDRANRLKRPPPKVKESAFYIIFSSIS